MTVATNLRVFASEISQGLREFQRRHPEIRLRLFFLRDDPLMESVLSGNADIALTLEPGPLGLKPGLRHEIFGEADYLLVTPKKHSLANRKNPSLRDIVEFPLVLGDAETYSRKRVQEVFHRQHLLEHITVAVETNSDEYSTNCVRCGMGIAIAVGTVSASLYRGLHVRSLRHWFGCVRLCHIRRHGTQLSLAQSELVQDLTSSLSR
jgi:DNA-binding transcriptional LysR family regulator